MKILFVHPGPLLYTNVFLRLEPLGLELVAEAARRARHSVRLLDLQVESHAAYHRMIAEWQPDFIAFSCNYLANVPEIVDLAKATKLGLPRSFICVGGHSASFTASAILEHGEGARGAIAKVPGAVTPDGEGPRPGFVEHLDEIRPARDLVRKRRKYFIGVLDPCASIEFSRGCPWDCSFCSAWTFYGRSYRLVSPERAVEDLRSIREPGVFIVDDVAFLQERHGLAIGEAIARSDIKKQYYLETRGDVLLRHKEVFRFWKNLGLEYMFLGIEAIDEEGLQKLRKRATLGSNFEALEFARSLGIYVLINLIADPEWDRERFRIVREWGLELPEVVNISINTPYPGTESWISEAGRVVSRDYRLYDIQHAVLPTKLPLAEFYEELVTTQQAFYRKHMGWRRLMKMAGVVAAQLARGQTNFLGSLFGLERVFRPEYLLADHAKPFDYQIPLPAEPTRRQASLYVHTPRGRKGRSIDVATERFVDETRMSATS